MINKKNFDNVFGIQIFDYDTYLTLANCPVQRIIRKEQKKRKPFIN